MDTRTGEIRETDQPNEWEIQISEEEKALLEKIKAHERVQVLEELRQEQKQERKLFEFGPPEISVISPQVKGETTIHADPVARRDPKEVLRLAQQKREVERRRAQTKFAKKSRQRNRR